MGVQLSINQSFVDKLNDILEKKYQDETFGVEDLAQSANISRSQLHRKLQSIKGVSSSQFIKLFRLQKAYTLLKNDVATVSEIAYAVGFGSPSYFIKCFHEHYNFSPGELKHQTDLEVDLNEPSEPVAENPYFNLNKLFGNRIFTHNFHFGTFKIRTYPLVVLFLVAFCFAIFYKPISIASGQTPKSIAILPIEVNSKSIDKDILSAGIHEGLASALGKISKLSVLSRATTLKYTNSNLSRGHITKELGVDFLVSGKVHYSDKDSLVLNLTVYKSGDTEREVQNFNYNASIESIIDVQNMASKSIGISTGMLRDTNYLDVAQNYRKVNKNAYKNYIRGMYYLHKSSQEDFDKGIQYLYKALDDDPAEPLAYAGLAYGHVILGHSAAQNSNVFGMAKMAANKAIQLDSTMLEAYASMASIGIYHDRNWVDSENLFRYILSKNPSLANVHYDYAWYCLLIGEKEKAIMHQELAEKLDPFNVKYIAWSGWMYAYYSHFDKAMEKVETALRIAPNNAIAHLAQGFLYKQQNDTDKAMESYKKLFKLSPRMIGSLGSLYAETGELEKAHAIIEEVKSWSKSPWKNWTLAIIYASLNDADKAVEMLETEPKHAFVAWAPVLSEFKGIAHHNGFKAFVSGLNLPNINNQYVLANTNSQL